MRDRGVSLPTTALHHHLPCSNARWRGLRLVAHHHSTLEREMEGLCCPATALQFTPPPPPSLERETEGPCCPPPPLPHEHETEGPCCLATALQLTPPPPPSLKRELEGILAHHHPLVHSNATRISILMYLITL